jgi:AraC-like DNA-binding protein
MSKRSEPGSYRGDVSAGDLVDTWVDLPKVLGAGIDELSEKLTLAAGFDGKQKLMEDFFRRSRLASVTPEGAYRRAVSLVESSGGRIRVDALADALGVTSRTLKRMFRADAGVSPKKFIRLVRFHIWPAPGIILFFAAGMCFSTRSLLNS